MLRLDPTSPARAPSSRLSRTISKTWVCGSRILNGLNLTGINVKGKYSPERICDKIWNVHRIGSSPLQLWTRTIVLAEINPIPELAMMPNNRAPNAIG